MGFTVLFLQADKVTIVYPMRFQDSIDIVLATSFLQVFWILPFVSFISFLAYCSSWSFVFYVYRTNCI